MLVALVLSGAVSCLQSQVSLGVSGWAWSLRTLEASQFEYRLFKCTFFSS